VKDYYEVLGVASKATQAEIKAAFRGRAKLHHPDVNESSEGAENKFKRLLEAYEVLSDPKAREEYDRERNKEFAAAGYYSGSNPPGPASGGSHEKAGRPPRFSSEELLIRILAAGVGSLLLVVILFSYGVGEWGSSQTAGDAESAWICMKGSGVWGMILLVNLFCIRFWGKRGYPAQDILLMMVVVNLVLFQFAYLGMSSPSPLPPKEPDSPPMKSVSP